ncbi:uncharacterized protein [Henckelia pumila]|uniref:uncharacterized protein n=1 Tax=Henckelia pumila TaxID=405737 RepID=UPI003C6E1965
MSQLANKCDLFEIEYGGPENEGCTERDLRNHQRSLKDEHMGIDAETFIDCKKDKRSTFSLIMTLTQTIDFVGVFEQILCQGMSSSQRSESSHVFFQEFSKTIREVSERQVADGVKAYAWIL